MMQDNKSKIRTTVELSAVSVSDLSSILQWRNDIDLAASMTATPIPSTMQQVEAWYASTSNDRNQVLLGIHHPDSKQLIGLFRLMYIDWISRVAELGVYIGPREYRNGGRGTQSMLQGLSYGFEALNLNKIWLRVVSTNLPAIKIYKSLQFEEEGLLKEHFFAKGQYHDLIVMALTKQKFLNSVR
jgi:RimJ/RimL family protein N-acetyltransferase